MAVQRAPDKPDRNGRTYPKYDKGEWAKKPFEHDKPQWSEFRFERHQVGRDENLRRIAAKNTYLKDWKELTLLNWGTDDPEVVNWYLDKHCGCTEPTRDDKNYRFTNSIYPAKKKLWERVWVPVPLPRPPLVPIPLPVSPVMPNTSALEKCPHLIRGGDKCRLYKNLEGAQEDCEWPVNSAAKETLTLTSDKSFGDWLLEIFSRGEKKKRRTQTQLAEIYGLYRVQYDITPRLLPYAANLTNERMTMLSFSQSSEFNKKMGAFRPSGTPGGSSAKSSTKRVKEERWPPGVPLVSPGQLERLAIELKCMIDEGVLRRVVVRGFADHYECGGNFEDCQKLSKKRADWVIATMTGRFRLPLAKEPDVTSNPADVRHYEERVKMGFVPALAVDCGTHYSKHHNPLEVSDAKPHKKVIFEVELGEPEEKESAPASPSVSKAFGWYLYEFTQGGRVNKALFSMGTKNSGVADTKEKVVLMSDEALAYLDFVERILIHAGAPQSSIDNVAEIKLWVRQEWTFTGKQPLPQLSDRYYPMNPWEKTVPYLSELKPVDECVPGTSDRAECAPWIALPSSGVYANANHSRFATDTRVEFSYSSIEEKIAEKPESISWGPLIVDFKTDQPAGP